MHKDVISIFSAYKAVAFAIIEPLDRAIHTFFTCLYFFCIVLFYLFFSMQADSQKSYKSPSPFGLAVASLFVVYLLHLNLTRFFSIPIEPICLSDRFYIITINCCLEAILYSIHSKFLWTTPGKASVMNSYWFLRFSWSFSYLEKARSSYSFSLRAVGPRTLPQSKTPSRSGAFGFHGSPVRNDLPALILALIKLESMRRWQGGVGNVSLRHYVTSSSHTETTSLCIVAQHNPRIILSPQF